MRGKHAADDLTKSIYRFKDADPDYANSAIAQIFTISESTLEESRSDVWGGLTDRKSQIGSNAPPHTARITKQWLANNGIPVLDWPPIFSRFEPYQTCVGNHEVFETVCR